MSIVAIIPLYNGASFIEAALNSVLAQSRPADEIIVVDDGSTDDGAGARLVQEISQKNSRVQLLTKSNGGQGSARNFGVDHSTSNFIALLDQDDVWYPSHLEKLERFFVANSSEHLGWVYANLDSIDEFGEIIGRKVLDQLSDTPHPKRTLIDCLKGDMFVLPGASLIAREAFVAVGGFDAQFIGYEDDDLFLRLFVAGYQNAYLNEAVSQWRVHSSNTSSTEKMSISRRRYYEKISKSHPDLVKSVINPRFTRIAFQDYCFSMLNTPERVARAQNELRYFASKMPINRRLRFLLAAKIFTAARGGRLKQLAHAYLPKPVKKMAASLIRRI